MIEKEYNYSCKECGPDGSPCFLSFNDSAEPKQKMSCPFAINGVDNSNWKLFSAEDL